MVMMTAAEPSDLIEMYAADHQWSREGVAYRHQLGQLAHGEAVAFRIEPGAAPIAICGIVPVGEAGDCWFAVSPRAARHMLKLIRLARASLAKRADQFADRLCCFVQPDNAAGMRIAFFLGFWPTDDVVRGFVKWRQ